jgi:hypothetical protein
LLVIEYLGLFIEILSYFLSRVKMRKPVGIAPFLGRTHLLIISSPYQPVSHGAGFFIGLNALGCCYPASK